MCFASKMVIANARKFSHLYEIQNAIFAFQSIDVEHVLCGVLFLEFSLVSVSILLFGEISTYILNSNFSLLPFVSFSSIFVMSHWWRKTIFQPRSNYVIWIRTKARNYRKLCLLWLCIHNGDLRVHSIQCSCRFYIYHFDVYVMCIRCINMSIRIYSTNGIHNAQSFRCLVAFTFDLFHIYIEWIACFCIFMLVVAPMCLCVCGFVVVSEIFCIRQFTEYNLIQNSRREYFWCVTNTQMWKFNANIGRMARWWCCFSLK